MPFFAVGTTTATRTDTVRLVALLALITYIIVEHQHHQVKAADTEKYLIEGGRLTMQRPKEHQHRAVYIVGMMPANLQTNRLRTVYEPSLLRKSFNFGVSAEEVFQFLMDLKMMDREFFDLGHMDTLETDRRQEEPRRRRWTKNGIGGRKVFFAMVGMVAFMLLVISAEKGDASSESNWQSDDESERGGATTGTTGTGTLTGGTSGDRMRGSTPPQRNAQGTLVVTSGFHHFGQVINYSGVGVTSRSAARNQTYGDIHATGNAVVVMGNIYHNTTHQHGASNQPPRDPTTSANRMSRFFGLLQGFEQTRGAAWKETTFVVHFKKGGKEESGIDAGGLRKEWYEKLSESFFDFDATEHKDGLFSLCANGRTFKINPHSGATNPNHLEHYRFIGEIIGKAINDRHLLNCPFTKAIYKHLAGESKKITCEDLELEDPEYYKNAVVYVKEADEEHINALEMNFTYEVSMPDGKVKEFELIDKENDIKGSKTPLTIENRGTYLKMLCTSLLTESVKDQLDALLDGFHSIVSAELAKSFFNAADLELMINGVPEINVADMQSHTEYIGFNSESEQIEWFWQVVKGYNGNKGFTLEEKAKLLQFVTGSSRVPVGGFKNLVSNNEKRKFTIAKKYGDIEALPSSHTCFNTLDLPMYESREKLAEKLLFAIYETAGFGNS